MSDPRPGRSAAIALARDEFVHGRRVEMGRLAERLGVDRTTLYRWVGDRDRLLAIVLADLAEDTAKHIGAGVEGRGLDTAMTVLRRYVVATSTFAPAVEFAQREPGPALRIMLAQDGVVMNRVRQILTDLLSPLLPEEMSPVPAHLVEIIAQLSSALQWASIVVGEESPVDRVLWLVESTLRGARVSSDGPPAAVVSGR